MLQKSPQGIQNKPRGTLVRPHYDLIFRLNLVVEFSILCSTVARGVPGGPGASKVTYLGLPVSLTKGFLKKILLLLRLWYYLERGAIAIRAQKVICQLSSIKIKLKRGAL